MFSLSRARLAGPLVDAHDLRFSDDVPLHRRLQAGLRRSRAGIDGLGGIPPRRESRGGAVVVRPMLGVGRAEIRGALREIGVFLKYDDPGRRIR